MDGESVHPIQPLVMVDDVLRYKQNKIVRNLLDFASTKGVNLNTISADQQNGDYSLDDYRQFMQLIGYSHSGAFDLDCFEGSDIPERAMAEYEARSRAPVTTREDLKHAEAVREALVDLFDLGAAWADADDYSRAVGKIECRLEIEKKLESAAAYLETLAPDDSDQPADVEWLEANGVSIDIVTPHGLCHNNPDIDEKLRLCFSDDVNDEFVTLIESPTRSAVRHLLAAFRKQPPHHQES